MKTHTFSKKQLPGKITLLSLLLTAATCGFAQTNTWTGGAGDNNWSTAGNWNLNAAPTTGETPAFGAQGTGGLTLNNTLTAGTSFLGLNFNAGAPSFVLNGNSITTTGGILDSSTSLETINLEIVLAAASHSVNATAGGKLVVNGVIDDAAGGFGITTSGNGTVVLTTNSTYAGQTSVNAGTLELDFNTLAVNSAGNDTNNIINPNSILSLGGGTLEMNGDSTETNSQTFTSTAFTPGNSTVIVAPQTGTVTISNNLALGALSFSAGSTVMFVGPATSIAPSTATGQSGATGDLDTNGVQTTDGFVPATGNITTTAGAPNSLLTSSSAGVTLVGGGISAQAGFATVGLYDFAIVTGGGPYSIAAASQGTGDGGTGNDGCYIVETAQEANGLAANLCDIIGTAVSTRNTCNVAGYRFNSPGPLAFNATATESADAVLVTPNVGQFNVLINGAGTFDPGLRGGSAATMTLWQNNTGGELIINAQFANGKTAGSGYVQAGPGTVAWLPTAAAGNAYTGPTWLNGGVSIISADSAFGNVVVNAVLTLNGGTVFGLKTFSLDNGAATTNRPIALGLAGGGLAANTGAFLTVDGVISNAATPVGPLWVGIPSTSANGNVLGLVPGTGPNTGNTTPTNATGIVILTGTNTYTGGTVLYSGVLNFISRSLGTGGITFSGGTLQWATGTTLDVSTQTVTIGAAGGTLDLNGNNVTLANPIGNSGNGALTVTNGTLTLQGANTYTGGTIIGTGATLIAANSTGSGTGSGPVTVQSGATLEGPGAISGAVTVQTGGSFIPNVGTGTVHVGSLTMNPGSTYNVQIVGDPVNTLIVVGNSGGFTLNGGAFNLIGLSGPDTYNLVQFTGAVAGSGLDSTWTTPSDSNPHIINPNEAFVYSFSISGGFLSVTVTPNLSSVVADWTANANGDWTNPANWTPTRVPSSPGDIATLGASTALRTVTLGANEAVGSLTLTNANSFVITGTNTLTLDNSGAPAGLAVSGGTANAIQTPVALNSTADIAVSSSDKLTISGSITNESAPETVVVNGAGTLALSGNNGYGPGPGAFGTTLSGGGTLQVGNDNALGSSDLSVAGNSTLQAGGSVSLPNNIDIASAVTAKVDTQGSSLALNGTISDSGNLTKIGAGTLTLGGNSSYTGTTTINAGAVSISSDNNLGADTAVVLNGGDLAASTSVDINRNLNVGPALGAVGTNAFLDAQGSSTFFYINGTLASSGNTGANNLVVNANGGTGTVELLGPGSLTGTTVVSGGTLLVGNTAALASSVVNYNNQGGVLAFDGNSSIVAATFGGLTGDENLGLTNNTGGAVALTLGGPVSTTYSGSLTDAGLGGSLIVAGGATLTLTGTSALSGAATVNSGTLELTNNGSMTCATIGGGEFLVDGGSLNITNATATSTLANNAIAIFESAGSLSSAGIIRGNVNDGTFIEVTGGTFSAATLSLQRTQSFTTTPTAAGPVAASTTTGFYINSTNVASPANVLLGNLNIGTENSSCSVRLDAGTVTVTNEVLLGDTSNTRWDILQVNGGTFTDNDITNGITLSINNGTTNVNNSELYLSGGTTFAGIVNFGAQADTVGGEGVVIITNASFYIGSGGVNLSNTTGLLPVLYLDTGILGASADWSSAINGDGSTYGWILGIPGDDFAIQAADIHNVPHNITLSGDLGGPGNLVKTGGGTLTLSGVDNWTGNTTVSAGTLALVGDGVSTGFLQYTPTINIVSPGVVDVSGLPDDTFHVADSSIGQGGQALTGNGTVKGNLFLASGNLSPGITVSNYGNFTVTGTLTNNSLIMLKVDHYNTGISNDTITAQAITNLSGSSLIVDQIATNYLETGDVFHLFNIASGNDTNNLSVLLPVASSDNAITYVWDTSKLASQGIIKLTSGAAQTVNTTPTNILFGISGGNLNISWAGDHLGWTLQTNAVGLQATNAWFAYPGSTTVTSESIPILTSKNVLFRLVLITD